MSSIIRATTTSGLQVAPDNSGSLQLQTNGTTAAVTIDTLQNVGIGTSSPSSYGKFSVYNANVNGTATFLHPGNTSYGTVLTLQTYSGTDSPALSFNNYNGGSPVYYSIATNSSGALTFNSGGYVGSFGTERMRIDSSGQVMINTTTNPNTTKLTALAGNGQSAYAATNTSGTALYYALACYNNGTTWSYCGGVTVSGSNTAFATSSDYRLKENILPMTGALDKIAQLKPVTYKWKDSGLDGQGFIAHELQEVIPDCVIGEKDAVNEDGSIKPQSIDTSFLVATLTAAIQEQQTIINDLKARIETLEAK